MVVYYNHVAPPELGLRAHSTSARHTASAAPGAQDPKVKSWFPRFPIHDLVCLKRPGLGVRSPFDGLELELTRCQTDTYFRKGVHPNDGRRLSTETARSENT